VARVLDEGKRTFTDPDSDEAVVAEYLKLKTTIDSMEKRRKELYARVLEILDKNGYDDGTGNTIFDLDAPVEGVRAMNKMMRSSRPLNEEVALQIIESKGLHSEVYEMVEVLSEQKIMQALQQDLLTPDEVDAMYPVKTTYALTLKK
jgi:hypothetical protein